MKSQTKSRVRCCMCSRPLTLIFDAPIPAYVDRGSIVCEGCEAEYLLTPECNCIGCQMEAAAERANVDPRWIAQWAEG